MLGRSAWTIFPFDWGHVFGVGRVWDHLDHVQLVRFVPLKTISRGAKSLEMRLPPFDCTHGVAILTPGVVFFL